MSTFGGDSWAREANHRKRRVDDLMRDHQDLNGHPSDYKKLSNGKYACLVCPNNPVLDSLLMFSMHSKGSRHIAAAAKLKEQELLREEELNKRIALGSCSSKTVAISDSNQWFEKPLTKQTQNATSPVLKTAVEDNSNTSGGSSCFDLKHQCGSSQIYGLSHKDKEDTGRAELGPRGMLSDQLVELRKQRERELKFIQAGWKRDSHGKWFRDENVEFDSDEEDPNDCL
ncbi:hypothetical protein H6P81_010799 [Aristolochia fimbriata]|uniref:Sodium channel modifier 1 n=1 Tax=Aristolochia fimbriata TaxID=158543 RepID=A0AAV7EQY1_ARIFI|nr:hypothetical protein H6P81_010799 [Aristolochia fimbriata]